MSIKRLLDAVERGGDIGRRVAALVLPISNRPGVTSSCAGKVRLRQPGEHTSGPNLASRDNVVHSQTLYTILHSAGGRPEKLLSSARRRACIEQVRAQLHVSERCACAALGQHRSTQRKIPRGREDEERLT